MEEEEEYVEEVYPKCSSYSSQKARPLLCWGRGMTRTPVSELPDFSGILEFENHLLLERACVYKNERDRARRRSRDLCLVDVWSRLVGQETTIRDSYGRFQKKKEDSSLPITSRESTSKSNKCANTVLLKQEVTDSVCSSSSVLEDIKAHNYFRPITHDLETRFDRTDEEGETQTSELQNVGKTCESPVLDGHDTTDSKTVQSSLLCDTNENPFLPVTSTHSTFMHNNRLCRSCSEFSTKPSDYLRTQRNNYISQSLTNIASLDESSFRIQLLSSASRFSSICSENSSRSSKNISSTSRYSCNSWSTRSMPSRNNSRNNSDASRSSGNSPLMWNMERNFAEISVSSQNHLGRKSRPEKELVVPVTEPELFDSVLEPVCTSSDESRLSSGELSIPEFLETVLPQSEAHLEKPETLIIKMNSSDVRKVDLEKLLLEFGARISEIDLMGRGKCQEVRVQILNCDGAYIVENLNGSSPFGPSVGAIRCKLL